MSGDGLVDLVSGSNCCAPGQVHVLLQTPDGSFAARRDVRFDRPDVESFIKVLVRGRTRPHVLDWDGDGRPEIVVGHSGSRKLYIVPNPLVDTEQIVAKPYALPVPENSHPVDVSFADWDGDGRFDVLAAMQYRENTDDPFRYGIFWLRNTSAVADPAFAAPLQLAEIPKPWNINGLCVVDWGQDGRFDLVVGAVKDRKREKGRGWLNAGEVWLYQRRLEKEQQEPLIETAK